MNRTDSPKKQAVPFGVNGQREDLLATTPAGDNTASYDSGFPAITMTLKAAGGLPPKGQDMNQILFELSSIGRWLIAGALNTFDATFSTAIGGYPKGAVLLSDDGTNIFVSTAESNTNNPNSSSTGWLSLLSFMGAAPLASPTFTGVPRGPTATAGTSSNQLATTAFVLSSTPGRLINVRTFSSSTTYTKTPGTNSIIVEMIGAGGASGSVTATGASQYSITTPGSMGAYAKVRFTTGFDGQTITIGSGGVGSTGAGPAGGASSFGSLLICPGGPGSVAGALGTLPVVTGGPSGPSAPTVTGGTLIQSEFGQSTPPAAAISNGVFLNYVTTDRSQLGNAGIGGNGYYNSVGSSQKIGLNGSDGLCVVWEFS